MRGAASAALAVPVVLAIVGLGFAAQVAALPRPSTADRVAAGALSWLLRDELVSGAVRVGHGLPMHTLCVQGPVLFAGRHSEAAVLSAAGRRVVFVGGRAWLRHGGRLFTLRRTPVEMEAAGCGVALAPGIVGAIQAGTGLWVRPVTHGKHAALRLRIRGASSWLTVDIRRSTGVPFAVEVGTDSYARRALGFFRLRILGPRRRDFLLRGLGTPVKPAHRSGPR